MTSKKMLSESDVAKLLSNPSVEVRTETAIKIAEQFGGDHLSPTERQIAEEIFRLMVKDAEVRVREALAENLKSNSTVPHDIAKTLAADVDSVALPVLQFSDVLNDDDLMELIKTQSGNKQTAIASRADVSETIVDALVETGDETVVAKLVSNEGAHISDKTFTKVVNELGTSEAVQTGMVNRSSLPLNISERLVSMVSENLKAQLVSKHELSPNLATDLILQSREKATLGLSIGSSDEELENLVHSMNTNGRLTISILLRSLCVGDVAFFEAGLVELADLPVQNARKLLREGGMRGLQGVYGKTSLSSAFFPLVKVAIDVAHENQYDGEENDRERYMRRMIERIMTQYEELGVDIDSDDLDYLLGKVNELPGARMLEVAS
jgi:uncharacterized protein (DUF2336 family)